MALMMTGLYSNPRRTGRNVACAGGGGPTRGHGALFPGRDEKALRLRATVSTAACGEIEKKKKKRREEDTQQQHHGEVEVSFLRRKAKKKRETTFHKKKYILRIYILRIIYRIQLVICCTALCSNSSRPCVYALRTEKSRRRKKSTLGKRVPKKEAPLQTRRALHATNVH